MRPTNCKKKKTKEGTLPPDSYSAQPLPIPNHPSTASLALAPTPHHRFSHLRRRRPSSDASHSDVERTPNIHDFGPGFQRLCPGSSLARLANHLARGPWESLARMSALACCCVWPHSCSQFGFSVQKGWLRLVKGSVYGGKGSVCCGLSLKVGEEGLMLGCSAGVGGLVFWLGWEMRSGLRSWVSVSADSWLIWVRAFPLRRFDRVCLSVLSALFSFISLGEGSFSFSSLSSMLLEVQT